MFWRVQIFISFYSWRDPANLPNNKARTC
jgi:hypothetical protein